MPVCWKLSYLNINSLSRIYWGVIVIGGDWCLYTRQNQDVRLLAHNDILGRLWLPPGRHVLGSDAAALLLPHIHSSEQPHHRRLAFDVNMSGNCCVHVLLQLCVRRKMLVAFDAACYIKHVVKSHLKKNRPSTWPRLSRRTFKRALTKQRRRPMRTLRCLPPSLICAECCRVTKCSGGAFSACSSPRCPECLAVDGKKHNSW